MKISATSFDVKIIKRSKGRSSIQLAAYQSGQRIYDERLQKWYGRNRSDVLRTEILLPEGAPEWMRVCFRMDFQLHDRRAIEIFRGRFCSYIPGSDRLDGEAAVSEFGPYYISPSCEYLLKPQNNDGVEFDRWYWDRQHRPYLKDPEYQPHYGLVRIKSHGKEIFSSGVTWDSVEPHEDFTLPVKIIQRNGQPFHWPEVEEVAG